MTLKKYGWFLLSLVIALIILCWGYTYTSSETHEIVEPVKTLDSEIDRLSVKYGVASSTVRAVITCESQMYGSALNKNYRTTTTTIDGVATTTRTHWSTDFGYLQVNDFYHKADMQKLGLEITNEWDSLEYGFMLMRDQGLAPWRASRSCWINKI